MAVQAIQGHLERAQPPQQRGGRLHKRDLRVRRISGWVRSRIEPLAEQGDEISTAQYGLTDVRVARVVQNKGCIMICHLGIPLATMAEVTLTRSSRSKLQTGHEHDEFSHLNPYYPPALCYTQWGCAQLLLSAPRRPSSGEVCSYLRRRQAQAHFHYPQPAYR